MPGRYTASQSSKQKKKNFHWPAERGANRRNSEGSKGVRTDFQRTFFEQFSVLTKGIILLQ